MSREAWPETTQTFVNNRAATTPATKVHVQGFTAAGPSSAEMPWRSRRGGGGGWGGDCDCGFHFTNAAGSLASLKRKKGATPRRKPFTEGSGRICRYPSPVVSSNTAGDPRPVHPCTVPRLPVTHSISDLGPWIPCQPPSILQRHALCESDTHTVPGCLRYSYFRVIAMRIAVMHVCMGARCAAL